MSTSDTAGSTHRRVRNWCDVGNHSVDPTEQIYVVTGVTVAHLSHGYWGFDCGHHGEPVPLTFAP